MVTTVRVVWHGLGLEGFHTFPKVILIVLCGSCGFAWFCEVSRGFVGVLWGFCVFNLLYVWTPDF